MIEVGITTEEQLRKMMIDLPDSEGYRFIVGPTDQLHLKKLYLYQLEKDLCPKKRSLSTEKQKVLLINGGNLARKKEHFMGRKRVFQIQHG